MHIEIFKELPQFIKENKNITVKHYQVKKYAIPQKNPTENLKNTKPHQLKNAKFKQV